DTSFHPIMAKRGWSDGPCFSCLLSIEDSSDTEEDRSGRVWEPSRWANCSIERAVHRQVLSRSLAIQVIAYESTDLLCFVACQTALPGILAMDYSSNILR